MSKGNRIRRERDADRRGERVRGRQYGNGTIFFGLHDGRWGKMGRSRAVTPMPTSRPLNREMTHDEGVRWLNERIAAGSSMAYVDNDRKPWRRPKDENGRKMKSAQVRSTMKAMRGDYSKWNRGIGTRLHEMVETYRGDVEGF